MAHAVALDRALSSLADAVAFATAELEADDQVPEPAWNAIADTCPPELLGAVEAARS